MNAVKSPTRPGISPLADMGFFISVDGNEVNAEAIDFLLGKLPVRDRWCVEFGAGADAHGSTTHRMITGQGYSAVLIEGVPEKKKYLVEVYKDNPKVTIFDRFVSFDPGDENCLDRILAKTPIPRDFDFLSIDIDGNDYHVWNAVKVYTPKVLMIEFNPTIPPAVDYVQPADPSVNIGNSLTALTRLARSKSYELVSVLGVNAFFVQAKLFPLFGITDNRVEALWTKQDCVTYIFSGFDGSVKLSGSQKLPWHNSIPIRETRMQVLPGFLQKYAFTRRDWKLYLLMYEPRVFFKRLLGWLGKN